MERPLARYQGMNWTHVAGVGGAVVGMAVGTVALQLRLPPLVQSVAAVAVAILLSGVVTLFLWLHSPGLRDATDRTYFGFGPENLLYLGLSVALAAVLHVGLGILAGRLSLLAEHRAVILGCAGGVYSAVSVAKACPRCP